MAHEHPPATASAPLEALKSYRPDAARVARTYAVKKQADPNNPMEDWVSVARATGVEVVKLIDFNFPGSVVKGKVVPEIVNWYLHHHKDFGCPDTRNGVNRRFRGGETLYIPKEDPWERLIERLRTRLKKAVEVLRERLKKMMAGETSTLANPSKSPAVLRYWQEEVEHARSQLEDNERSLRELALAEQKEGNPKKVWDAITRSRLQLDEMIRLKRDSIERINRRLNEAQVERRRATSPADIKFWDEVIEGHRATLQSQQVDLSAMIRDQQDARRAQ